MSTNVELREYLMSIKGNQLLRCGHGCYDPKEILSLMDKVEVLKKKQMMKNETHFDKIFGSDSMIFVVIGNSEQIKQFNEDICEYSGIVSMPSKYLKRNFDLSLSHPTPLQYVYSKNILVSCTNLLDLCPGKLKELVHGEFFEGLTSCYDLPSPPNKKLVITTRVAPSDLKKDKGLMARCQFIKL